jgi:tetratricopeptide (TPR) repeat protein
VDISCDTQHLLYEYGYDAYTHGHFQKAVAVFRFLILLNPNEGRTWFALGSSLMMSSQDHDITQQAIQTFTIAEMHMPSDARPALFKAECLARCGKITDAEIALTTAELLLSDSEKSLLQNQIELIKMNLLKQGKEG